MTAFDDEITFNPFTEQGWDDFLKRVEHFVPSEETMRRALGATNARMSKWMRAKASRELPHLVHLPRNVIHNRFRAFRTWGEISGGKLWLGLNGVPFIRLHPTEAGRGVVTKDGSYYEEGAFLVTIRKTGRMAVFRRVGSRRYPLDIPKVDIYDPCLLWLRQQINHPEFARVFFSRLEHEIQWRTTPA